MSQPISNGLLDLKLLGHWFESNPSHYHLNAIPSFEVVTETNSPISYISECCWLCTFNSFIHANLTIAWRFGMRVRNVGVGSVGRIHWTDIQERNTENVQSILFYLLIEKKTTHFAQWKMLGEKKQTQITIFILSIISQYFLKWADYPGKYEVEKLALLKWLLFACN